MQVSEFSTCQKSYKTDFSRSKYANLPPKMSAVSWGQICQYDAWFAEDVE